MFYYVYFTFFDLEVVTEMQTITENMSISKNSNIQPMEEMKNSAEEEKKRIEKKEVEEAGVSPTNFTSLLDDLSLPSSVISRISTPTPSFVGE